MTIESFNEKVVRIQQEGPTTTKTLLALQPPKPYVGGIDLSMLSCLSILFFLLYYYFASCLCQNSNLNSIIQIIFVKNSSRSTCPPPQVFIFSLWFFLFLLSDTSLTILTSSSSTLFIHNYWRQSVTTKNKIPFCLFILENVKKWLIFLWVVVKRLG